MTKESDTITEILKRLDQMIGTATRINQTLDRMNKTIECMGSRVERSDVRVTEIQTSHNYVNLTGIHTRLGYGAPQRWYGMESYPVSVRTKPRVHTPGLARRQFEGYYR